LAVFVTIGSLGLPLPDLASFDNAEFVGNLGKLNLVIVSNFYTADDVTELGDDIKDEFALSDFIVGFFVAKLKTEIPRLYFYA